MPEAARKKKEEKESVAELVKSLAIAVVLAIIFRSLFFEPFYIPSGSMKSTLLVGDYVFVSKYTYGYSKHSFPFSPELFTGRIKQKTPKRGDIIVFKLPTDNSTNYIKRLIGMPGDTIQVKSGVLYLNKKAIPKVRIDNFLDKDDKGNVTSIPQFIETLPNGVSYRVLDQYRDWHLDDTIEYTVPKGHYFFMGDNRDNSQDSRVIHKVGYVPVENLLGPANFLFFSSASSLLKFWKWPSSIRIKRIFSSTKYQAQ